MTQETQNAKYIWLVEKISYRVKKVDEDIEYYTQRRASCTTIASKSYYDGVLDSMVKERQILLGMLYAIDEV